MKSKKKRSQKRRRDRKKAGKQGLPNLLPQISQEQGQQLAATTTGEFFQPIRVHYDMLDTEQLQARFSKLHCMEYADPQNRWVWLYTKEAKRLKFRQNPRTDAPVVLGEFLLKGDDKGVLNLRSFERATEAIVFFDKHVRRSVFQATAVTIVNRLFRVEEVISIPSLDQFFESFDVEEQDPEVFLRTAKGLVSGIDDLKERFELPDKHFDETIQTPMPEMERLPIHYYEDGIGPLTTSLTIRQIIAMEHWKGNTDYTWADYVRDSRLIP